MAAHKYLGFALDGLGVIIKSRPIIIRNNRMISEIVVPMLGIGSDVNHYTEQDLALIRRFYSYYKTEKERAKVSNEFSEYDAFQLAYMHAKYFHGMDHELDHDEMQRIVEDSDSLIKKIKSYENQNPAQLEPNPGIIPVLRKWREQYVPFVLITDSHIDTDKLYEQLLSSEFKDLFSSDDIIASRDYGCKKPSEKILRAALKRLGLRKKDVGFVLHDLDEIYMAQRGYKVIVYTPSCNFDEVAGNGIRAVEDFSELIFEEFASLKNAIEREDLRGAIADSGLDFLMGEAPLPSKIVDELASSNPENYLASYYRGLACYNEADFQGAIDSFEKTLSKLKSKDDDLTCEEQIVKYKSEFTSTIANVLAVFCSGKGQGGKVKNLKQSLDTAKNTILDVRRKKKHSDSKDYYEKLESRLISEYVESCVTGAEACRILGDWGNEINFYKRALKFDRKSTLLHNCLANAYFSQGMYDLAKAVYERAHKIDPDNKFTMVGMANCYERLGDTENAILFLRSASQTPLDVDNGLKTSYYELLASSDPDDEMQIKIEAGKKLLELEDSLENHLMLGSLYTKVREIEKAVEHFDLAIDSYSDGPKKIDSYRTLKLVDAYLSKAFAYFQSAITDKAHECLEDALHICENILCGEEPVVLKERRLYMINIYWLRNLVRHQELKELQQDYESRGLKSLSSLRVDIEHLIEQDFREAIRLLYQIEDIESRFRAMDCKSSNEVLEFALNDMVSITVARNRDSANQEDLKKRYQHARMYYNMLSEEYKSLMVRPLALVEHNETLHYIRARVKGPSLDKIVKHMSEQAKSDLRFAAILDMALLHKQLNKKKGMVSSVPALDDHSDFLAEKVVKRLEYLTNVSVDESVGAEVVSSGHFFNRLFCENRNPEDIFQHVVGDATVFNMIKRAFTVNPRDLDDEQVECLEDVIKDSLKGSEINISFTDFGKTKRTLPQNDLFDFLGNSDVLDFESGSRDEEIDMLLDLYLSMRSFDRDEPRPPTDKELEIFRKDFYNLAPERHFTTFAMFVDYEHQKMRKNKKKLNHKLAKKHLEMALKGLDRMKASMPACSSEVENIKNSWVDYIFESGLDKYLKPERRIQYQVKKRILILKVLDMIKSAEGSEA